LECGQRVRSRFFEPDPITFTQRDPRCRMINLDYDTGSSHHKILKPVVRANQTNAGIYATVTRSGYFTVGQTLSFLPPTGA
jgi:hypothetical protein